MSDDLRQPSAYRDIPSITTCSTGYCRCAEKAQRIADLEARLADLHRPTHGPCCTCQRCGKHYDDCRCGLDEVVAELAEERALLLGVALSVASKWEYGQSEILARRLRAAIDAAREPKTKAENNV